MKTLLLIVAALALAVAVPARATTAPTAVSSDQFNAMEATLGVTLPSGQTVATIQRIVINATGGLLATPYRALLVFPGSVTYSVPISSTVYASFLAAGPTLSPAPTHGLEVSVGSSGSYSAMTF